MKRFWRTCKAFIYLNIDVGYFWSWYDLRATASFQDLMSLDFGYRFSWFGNLICKTYQKLYNLKYSILRIRIDPQWVIAFATFATAIMTLIALLL